MPHKTDAIYRRRKGIAPLPHKDMVKKLKLNLFPERLKEDYESAKKEWQENKSRTIKDSKEYVPGGFLSAGYYRKTPEVGKAEADRIYGKDFKSFQDWSNFARKLTSTGHQEIIDKINELVDALNGKKERRPPPRRSHRRINR